MNERLVKEVANQPLDKANGQIPSPIRRRVARLQDDADEAELRAQMVEWMIDSFPIGKHGPDRVKTLREGAEKLRLTASRLLAPISVETDRVEITRAG